MGQCVGRGESTSMDTEKSAEAIVVDGNWAYIRLGVLTSW